MYDIREAHNKDLEEDEYPCNCDDCYEAEREEHQRKVEARAFTGFKFVNVYDVNQQYGGPEEGGWWYSVGRFLKSRPCRTRAEAEKVAERWKRYLDHIFNDPRGSRANLSSVLCEGRLVVHIQDHPGEDYPNQRPHPIVTGKHHP